MDTKAKLTQSTTDGTADNLKKNSDTNNKSCPKVLSKNNGESSGIGNCHKQEQPRRYSQNQKHDSDKRQRPKGQYNGGAKEDSKVVEEESVEFGSALVQGSKKQNWNHLLNFHLEPRDAQGESCSWNAGKWRSGYNRNGNRWLPAQRHKYNKEQFVQASYQFVVSASGDYTSHLNNPDILVEWRWIEQIVCELNHKKVYSSERLLCPICLCTPIAGKMTRCGHIYCWPCILHCLHVSDNAWCNCPICYVSVYKSDLKSMIELTQNKFNLGDTVNLRLMRRERNLLFAIPAEAGMCPPTTFVSVSEHSDNQIYSKLLIADVKDVMDIIECERTQLKFELMNTPDYSDKFYIELALNELLIREEKLLLKNFEIHGDSCSKEDAKSLTESSSKIMNGISNDVQSTSGTPKFVYFYQADDGQHMYLHAMNVEMLKMEYGKLESCPSVVTGKILEKRYESVTEELRRRLPYLHHLPLTCQLEIVEIELKPPFVSAEILHSFQDQLTSRQKLRKRREREERKREKKIMEEENKRMGIFPTPDVHIESHLEFPRWHTESLEEGTPSTSESAASSTASSPSLSTFDEIALTGRSEQSQEQAPSFAEMLRNTGSRKPANAWPSVASVRSKTNSALTIKSSNIDEEAYISVPSQNQTFGDALAHALEQNELLKSGIKVDDNTGNKKKKKKKVKTILTSGMPCTSSYL